MNDLNDDIKKYIILFLCASSTEFYLINKFFSLNNSCCCMNIKNLFDLDFIDIPSDCCCSCKKHHNKFLLGTFQHMDNLFKKKNDLDINGLNSSYFLNIKKSLWENPQIDLLDDIIIFLKNSKKKYASITNDEKNILMSNYLQPLLIKEKENVEHELCKMYIHKEWFDLYFNVTKIII